MTPYNVLARSALGTLSLDTVHSLQLLDQNELLELPGTLFTPSSRVGTV